MNNVHFLFQRLRNNFFIKIFLYLGITGGIMLSCDEDPERLGLNLLPNDDFVDVKRDSSFAIDAFTIGPERIVTSNKTVVHLGCYNDPVFGNLRADFMIQMTPTGYRNFGDNIVVDTVELNIGYSLVVGDTMFIPQFEVYRLISPLLDSVDYYSDTDPSGYMGGSNLVLGDINSPDSSYLNVRLSNDIGNFLMGFANEDDTTFYVKDSVFDSRFYGIYVKTICPNQMGNIIGTQDIRLQVKFHSDSISEGTYTFYWDSESDIYDPYRDKEVNIFVHESNPPGIPHLNDNYLDTAIYVQSMGGTQAIINIQGLEALKQQHEKIIINKAEIFIPVLQDSSELALFPPPVQMGLRPEGGEYEYVPDDIIYSTYNYNQRITLTYLNGRYNSYRNGYYFFLTKYFQDYFDGLTTSTSFRLYSAWLNTGKGHTDFSAADYNRVILGSGTNLSNKLTFILAYTIIN